MPSPSPSPYPHPTPHSDREEPGALCYSLLTTNNSELSAGKLVETSLEVLSFYHSSAPPPPLPAPSPRGSLLSIHYM